MTPDTTSYLALGLAVVFSVLGFYALSLVIRLRNAQKDAALIRELSQEPSD